MISSAYPDLLEELQARAAITELITRYAQSLDDRDFDRFRQCLTEDVVIDHAIMGRNEGIDAVLRTALDAASRLAASHHLTGNISIRLTERGSATAEWDIYAMHVFRGEGQPVQAAAGARYSAGLCRADEGWRLHEISIRSLWADPELAALFGRADRSDPEPAQ